VPGFPRDLGWRVDCDWLEYGSVVGTVLGTVNERNGDKKARLPARRAARLSPLEALRAE